jgi:hypothetical protein
MILLNPRKLSPRYSDERSLEVMASTIDFYPSDEAMEAAERDEIVLAGCMVGDLEPTYYCRRCFIAFEYARQFA